MIPNDKFIVACDFLNEDGRVFAFHTKRCGGVSTGPYASMNCTHYCGDAIDNVRRNRELLLSSIPYKVDDLLLPRQVHGNKVLDLRADSYRAGMEDKDSMLDGVDAIVTSLKGICITVSTADCVPLTLSSPDGVIAVAHAGWRGTLSHIANATVAVMVDNYGCDPSSIKAHIGPSISKEVFEVGDEVYDAFARTGFDMDLISFHNKSTGKWHIDLWGANESLLISSGLLKENIRISGICSYTNYETYFSARRLGVQSGRMLSGIMLI